MLTSCTKTAFSDIVLLSIACNKFDALAALELRPTHVLRNFFPVVLVDILLFLFVKIVATGNVATDLEYWSGIGSRNVGCIKYDLVAMGNVATDLEYWSGIGSGNVGCIKYD